MRLTVWIDSMQTLISVTLLFFALRRLAINYLLCCCTITLYWSAVCSYIYHYREGYYTTTKVDVLYHLSDCESISSYDCCVCMRDCYPVIFWPCSHSVCCFSCTVAICNAKQQCPICRDPVYAVVSTKKVNQSPHRDKACRLDTFREARE